MESSILYILANW